MARARAENVEFDYGRNFLPGKAGVIRLLGYVNHGNMGSYREAIHEFEDGQTATPDVTATEKQGRVKYGLGVNVEQQLLDQLEFFGRWGWNEGHNESFCYTEVSWWSSPKWRPARRWRMRRGCGYPKLAAPAQPRFQRGCRIGGLADGAFHYSQAGQLQGQAAVRILSRVAGPTWSAKKNSTPCGEERRKLIFALIVIQMD